MASIATITPISSKRSLQRLGTNLAFMGTITGTASYATSGDTLSAKVLGMSEIEGGLMSTVGNHTFQVVPNTADGDAKIIVFVTSTGVQLGNGVSWAADLPFSLIFGH